MIDHHSHLLVCYYQLSTLYITHDVCLLLSENIGLVVAYPGLILMCPWTYCFALGLQLVCDAYEGMTCNYCSNLVRITFLYIEQEQELGKDKGLDWNNFSSFFLHLRQSLAIQPSLAWNYKCWDYRSMPPHPASNVFIQFRSAESKIQRLAHTTHVLYH